jgi:transglutaminase-like putative cysteine protease
VVGEQVPPGAPYTVAGTGTHNAPLSDAERAMFTAVAADTDPRIPALARDITKNATTDEARVHAVTAYLNATCTYSLNQPPARSYDLIANFLFDSHVGHCEYFATAAALLLRSAGVPCRYINGFVSDEQNVYGGYWVARNKDAHAWLEVYFPGKGWTVVEATPANGVPLGEQPTRFAQLWDYARHQVMSAIAAIRTMGFREVVDACARALTRWWPAIAVALVFVAAVAGFVRHLAKRRKNISNVACDPEGVTLNGLLRAMDRKTAKLGFVRAENETISRFADRIDHDAHADVARWYHAYALARYGRDADAMSIVNGQK